MEFPTIGAFRDYFESNKSLNIPPEGSLSIKNMEPLSHIRRSSLEVYEVKNDRDLLFLLNDMIVPLNSGSLLNRCFHFTQLPKQRMLCTRVWGGTNFTVTFPKGAQLTMRRAEYSLYIRASFLFHWMVINSIPQMTFNEGVRLVGLKKELLKEAGPSRFFDFEDTSLYRGMHSLFSLAGLKEETPNKANPLERILKEANCPGVQFTLQGDKKVYNDKYVRFGATEEEFDFYVEDCLILSNTLKFSLHERYTYSENDFLERMRAYPQLNLPVDEKLIIRGPSLEGLIELWRQKLDGKPHFFYFILSQLLLPLEMDVAIWLESPIWSFDKDKGELEISSASKLIIKLTHQGPRPYYCFIDLRHLAQQMRSFHFSRLTLSAGTELILYDLTPKEIANFRNWIASWQEQKISRGVEDFFLARLPYGGMWAFDPYNFKIKLTDNGLLFLLNRPGKTLSLSLVRPTSAAIFALSIAQSHPALLEGINHADPVGFFHLLFKSIFYFCCDTSRHLTYNNTIPNYFKQATKAAIEKAIRDETFNNHLDTIRKDPAISERLNKIMSLSPEEFDQLDHSKENESIKFILTTIKGIAFNELEGSPYLQAPIYSLIDRLNRVTTENVNELRDPV